MKLSVEEQFVVFQAQMTRPGSWATCEPMMEILGKATWSSSCCFSLAFRIMLPHFASFSLDREVHNLCPIFKKSSLRQPVSFSNGHNAAIVS